MQPCLYYTNLYFMYFFAAVSKVNLCFYGNQYW